MKEMPLFADQDDRDILSVGELTSRIKTTLERRFLAQWIRGEISEINRPRSGHIYLTIKDSAAQIRAVIWRAAAARLKFDIEEGQEIICRGDLDVYPPRGSYQLVIQSVEPVGEGALRLRLRKLQAKLENQGLFAAERKRPIPQFPRFIAVVTSPTGAAIKDFLEVSRRRWSGVRVLVIPTRVQGPGAAQQVARGVAAVARMAHRPDVLVVTRGGGSLEDLWCFNEEAVVRAVAECPVPVVSAVGHEVDVSLCDLAADLRALTPTEAAERILPSREAVVAALHRIGGRMQQQMRLAIEQRHARLRSVQSRRVLQHPTEPFHQLSRTLDQFESRLGLAINNHLQRCGSRLGGVANKLQALSPLAVLSRGYSVTTMTSGEIVQSAEQIQPQQHIQTRLQRGHILSRVEEVILPTGDESE